MKNIKRNLSVTYSYDKRLHFVESIIFPIYRTRWNVSKVARRGTTVPSLPIYLGSVIITNVRILLGLTISRYAVFCRGNGNVSRIFHSMKFQHLRQTFFRSMKLAEFQPFKAAFLFSYQITPPVITNTGTT